MCYGLRTLYNRRLYAASDRDAGVSEVTVPAHSEYGGISLWTLDQDRGIDRIQLEWSYELFQYHIFWLAIEHNLSRVIRYINISF